MKTIEHEIIKGTPDTFTLLENEYAYKNGDYYHVYISNICYTYGPCLGRWKIFTKWGEESICGNQGPLSPPLNGFEIITTQNIIDMRTKLQNFEDYMLFGARLT